MGKEAQLVCVRSDPARAKPPPVAPISFYLHKLFVPLHAKIGGVISHDLGYSTQKKKADFASAGPADIEYQNSGCVLCLDREIQNPLVNLLRLTSVQDFQKWQNKIIARLNQKYKT